MTSKISSISLRNITSLVLLTLGQYRKRPSTTCGLDQRRDDPKLFWFTYFLGQSSILLQELDDAVCQLRMVHTQALDLVQRYQHPRQEELVFLFQRKRKTVDDRPENFEKFSNTVEPFGFVDELEKYIVDGSPNVRA